MQALGVPEGRAHGLHAGTGQVVEGILGCEGPAGGLGVGTEGQGLGILGIEGLDDLRPEDTGGPHLGHFHEVVLADGPEEAQTGSELVHGQARVHAGAEVLPAIGQGVRHLDVGGGAGLLHMVARDGDTVELGHVLGGIGEDVADDPHGRGGGIDVGVADHELLEDVVLDGAGQQLLIHALLFARHDVEGEDGEHRAVHGHGHGHLIEGDTGEQDLHIEDGVHGHARLADVAHHPGMIGVIAAVGREVERDGQTLLARRQVPAVEGVTLLGGGEAGVLPDGPGPGHIHGGVRPAQIRGHARHEVQVVHVLVVVLSVQGPDVDLLHGMVVQILGGLAGLLLELLEPLFIGHPLDRLLAERDVAEIYFAH